MDKPTILIVEDNPRHLRLIRDNLEDEGYKKVIEATNVEDALKEIHKRNEDLSGKSQPPLIVLIDVAIPESNGAKTSEDGGVKLLRKLRDEEKIQIPAIFVTIWATKPDVMDAAKEYKVPVVSKPLDMKRLLREIRKASRK